MISKTVFVLFKITFVALLLKNPLKFESRLKLFLFGKTRQDQDRQVTVTGHSYRSIFSNIFGPNWIIWTWRTCGSNRTAPQATQRMSQTIYWIPRNGPVGWSPRLCDLAPLDHYLWGYVKSMVYANKPATIDELRTNIEREIAAVSADLCLKIVKNWVQHLDFCKRARDGHPKEMEFHS